MRVVFFPKKICAIDLRRSPTSSRRYMKSKKVVFLVAGCLVLLSLLTPYLFIIFSSPQYPTHSPKMYLYANALTGDLHQWEVVGRYIGIKVPPDFPELESNIVVYIIGVFAAVTLAAAFMSLKVKKVVSILLITMGISLAGWAQYRLYQSGHSLDPTAPMRYVVKPFTSPLIGVTRVSKIRIYHLPHIGFIFLAAAVVLTVHASWRESIRKPRKNTFAARDVRTHSEP